MFIESSILCLLLVLAASAAFFFGMAVQELLNKRQNRHNQEGDTDKKT